MRVSTSNIDTWYSDSIPCRGIHCHSSTFLFQNVKGIDTVNAGHLLHTKRHVKANAQIFKYEIGVSLF